MAENEGKKRAREEARAEKRRARLEKHAVACPHCGKSVLDHMTQCPYCGGALTPAGYAPMPEEKRRAIRRVTYAVGIVIAVAIAAAIIVLR